MISNCLFLHHRNSNNQKWFDLGWPWEFLPTPNSDPVVWKSKRKLFWVLMTMFWPWECATAILFTKLQGKTPKMEMIWPRIPWWPWHNFENVYSLTVWSYPPCFIKIQQQSLKIFPSLLLLGFMTIKQWDQWAYNHCVIITDH